VRSHDILDRLSPWGTEVAPSKDVYDNLITDLKTCLDKIEVYCNNYIFIACLLWNFILILQSIQLAKRVLFLLVKLLLPITLTV